jgi:L-asparaginase
VKPKVVVVGTGGTIASRYDPALGRKVAAMSGSELLALLPGAAEIAEIEVDNFATVASFHMSVGFAFDLAQRVAATLRRPDVTGAVVTHGTDTMEESVYLTDLLLDSEKPAVFTGAQRSADEADADGPRNLLNAIRAAAAPAAAGLGAMIGFNDELHAARAVTKVHASAVQTFQSYDHGKLGGIDGDRVVIDRRPVPRPRYRVDRLEERVDLIKLVLGIDARPIDAALAAGSRGIVLEAFGLGNATREIAAGVARAVAAGVPVVVTSRCPAGRVRPVYGGGGGGRDLEDAGALFAPGLSGPKARLLLMVLLAEQPPMDELWRRLAAACG